MIIRIRTPAERGCRDNIIHDVLSHRPHQHERVYACCSIGQLNSSRKQHSYGEDDTGERTLGNVGAITIKQRNCFAGGKRKVLHISLLKESDAKDLLQFELENRRYFAASVSDRGDDYFSNFQTVMAEDIEEQKRGECQYYLARNSSGDIVGRVNLRGIGMQANLQTASLGYRIGERFSGKGYATLAVSLLCEKANYELNIHQLKAMVSIQNMGSQRVLEKSGFKVRDGTPTHFVSNGKTVQAIHYIKFLSE